MLDAFGDLALVIPLKLGEQLPIRAERPGKTDIGVNNVVLGKIGKIGKILEIVEKLKTFGLRKIPGVMMGVADGRKIIVITSVVFLFNPGSAEFLIEAHLTEPGDIPPFEPLVTETGAETDAIIEIHNLIDFVLAVHVTVELRKEEIVLLSGKFKTVFRFLPNVPG